ncbi:hypothetical protein M758_UG237800 [Ceratodon purpureus]|nr:hypothetical protein M758_UG237800 [Ceratodon purpureus]
MRCVDKTCLGKIQTPISTHPNIYPPQYPTLEANEEPTDAREVGPSNTAFEGETGAENGHHGAVEEVPAAQAASDVGSSSLDDGYNSRDAERNLEADSDEDDEPAWMEGEDQPISPEEMYHRDAARTPLFTDSRLSMLSVVILLLNCMRMHGAPSVLID